MTRPRVLIIDIHAVRRKALAAPLGLKWEVKTAGSYQQASNLLAGPGGFDALVTSVHLDEGNALDLIDTARKQSLGSILSIVHGQVQGGVRVRKQLTKQHHVDHFQDSALEPGDLLSLLAVHRRRIRPKQTPIVTGTSQPLQHWDARRAPPSKSSPSWKPSAMMERLGARPEGWVSDDRRPLKDLLKSDMNARNLRALLTRRLF